MLIRPVVPDDFDAWLPLWDGYNAFYGREGATALPRNVTDVLWSRFFDLDEPVHGLVAADGDRLLGLTSYLFHRNTTQIALTCYLQDLFTAPDTRGQGIGRALIEGVYEAADRAEAASVYWLTHTTNEPGRTLYDKVAQHSGFIVYAAPPRPRHTKRTLANHAVRHVHRARQHRCGGQLSHRRWPSEPRTLLTPTVVAL